MKSPSWGLLVGVVLVGAVAAVFALSTKLGAFEDVAIARDEAGPFVMVGKDHLGPYHKISDVIIEVETWAKSIGELCTVSFGEYLDNPETTDEDRLRSRGGCVLSAADGLNGKSLPAGYTITNYDKRAAVVATFGGSPSIGPWKVYPKAKEYIESERLTIDGAVLELYEVLGPTTGRTRYVFPVK